MMALFYSYLRSKVRRYKDILLTIIASKSALKWCKDIAKHQAERQRPPHLPGQNITDEQGTYDPGAIKKFHYNVAEAQLELHRQKHGVVHRNHRKSTQQTRRRRARSRREARHDLGLMLKMGIE